MFVFRIQGEFLSSPPFSSFSVISGSLKDNFEAIQASGFQAGFVQEEAVSCVRRSQ